MAQKIKTSIGLDTGLLSRLDALAATVGVSRSEVITRACEALVGTTAAGPMVECGRVLAPPSQAASAVAVLLPKSDEWGPVEVVVRVTPQRFEAWCRASGVEDRGPSSDLLGAVIAWQRTRKSWPEEVES